MKNYLVFIYICFLHCFNIQAQNEVRDIDGNIYKTVKIGSQIWMAENLKVSKFNNGDPIAYISDSRKWTQANEEDRPRTPAWCYYDNKSENENKYGKLYNWHVVSDKRGIAPKGWHVPSYEEIYIMFKFLGSLGANKMKSDGGRFETINGLNGSGFNGLPSGRRKISGSTGFNNEYTELGQDCYWWTQTTYDEYKSFALQMTDNSKVAYLQEWSKRHGLAIRCIKD